MTNKKFTKRALLLSVMTILLCFAMMLGTTYALFTDTASVGVNTIQAGTLDIVLEMQDKNGEWVNAEGKTLDFKKASTSAGEEVLWEPGCTYELPKIRVRNEGNLAAYVLLRVNGIIGDEALMEAIEFKTKVTNIPSTILSGSQANSYAPMEGDSFDWFYGTPDGTVMFDWTVAPKGEVTPNSGHTDTTAEFTVVGHMKEDAGNEYQGLKIEGVSITALATQAVYEYDSYGRDYDKGAALPEVVTSAAELKEAFANVSEGGKISLTSGNYDLAGETVALADGVSIVGNGSTEISNVKFTVADGQTASFSNVTIADNTTVQASADGELNFTDCKFEIGPDKVAGNSRAAAIVGSNQNNTVSLNLDGCTFNYQNEGDLYNAAIFMWSSVEEVTIKNCTFNGYGFVAVKLMNVAEGAKIVFENNTFNMSAKGSANYWYNTAVQIVPQHDVEFSVEFKNNTFNGGYQTGADLQSEYGFAADNTNSIVAEVSGMNYSFGLSKVTFTQSGNTVNGVAATGDNFAVKKA